ncbi:MAG TPA: oligopeptide/dipeptide ABC transporter ATP-binding protein [Candidatus Dormibacteraeota bacterium]|nr:oligopeptide/dipeptide ABC transporter ATP-binding protein [Candidatus Dormibacteraeota bacterium]
MSVLDVTDVVVEYRRPGRDPVRAVAGVSLSLDAARILGLVGETGCGKSSLARAAVGLVRPSAGSVRFNGELVTPLGRRTRPMRQTRLQMVFQDPFSSLNPRRKAGEQIADGLAISGKGSSGQRRVRVGDLLSQVGLPASAASRYPHEFSGGQRQRIAIARTLAAEPTVIVADEPLAALDASIKAQLANLMISLSRELGAGLLFISHDLAIVRHVADLVAVMYLGLVVEVAPTREMWAMPLHPYSEALIAAVPRLDRIRALPAALPGEVADPAHPPQGCRFHPRCPYVFDRCRIESPPLREVAPGRQVACWLQEQGRARALPRAQRPPA